GPVSRPASSCMRQTPVSASPARMARSTGAAPRHRGSSEKWTLTYPDGSAARTGGGISCPKATTTPSCAPLPAMSSRASLARSGVTTGRPSSVAAFFTGLGTRPPPRPRLRSGWVTTRAMSWPASCSARRARCASGGLPRKTIRTGPGTLLRPGRRPAAVVVDAQPADLPAGAAGAEDLHGLPAEIGVEPVEQEVAVEVVGLVEEDPAEQVLPFPDELLAVDVVAGQGDAAGPHDREVEARHRQAALLVLPALRGLHDRRVHHGERPVAGVVDEDPLLHADLVGGQPHAGSGVHRLDHVVGQPGQRSVELGHVGAALLETEVAEDPDREGRHGRRL